MKSINPETGICFFRIDESICLDEFLLHHADFSPLDVRLDENTLKEWLHYGSIYVNGVRHREPLLLKSEDVIRVHTRRKSYLTGVKFRERIVEENDDFLVLDKPGGLPTHPTLDNFIDNAKVGLEQELGIPILTTHRLDVPTEGLLIFAKNLKAQQILNREFSLGRVEKIYRSHNPRAVTLGTHVHYMDPESRVPKIVSHDEHPNWWRLELEVLKVGEVENHHWHEIKLLTGKTHQIRAQFAYLGSPVLGDWAYAGGSRNPATAERIALECFRLAFAFRSRTFAIHRPQSIVTPHLLLTTPKYFLSQDNN